MTTDDVDDWPAAYRNRPDLDRSPTTPAMMDGAVAFSLARTDGGYGYRSGMTGTRPTHRRAGQAGLAAPGHIGRSAGTP